MSKVISLQDFRDAQDTREQLRGPARCVGCGHTWEEVCPVGTYSGLECSACHTVKGVLVGLIGPPTRWVCACGNDLYHILPEGCQCIQCGIMPQGF